MTKVLALLLEQLLVIAMAWSIVDTLLKQRQFPDSSPKKYLLTASESQDRERR